MPNDFVDISENSIVSKLEESVEALIGVREELGKNKFYDNDNPWGCRRRTGIMASLQGVRAILGAVVVNEFGLKEKEEEAVMEEWKDVLDKLESMDQEPVLSARPYADMIMDLEPDNEESSPHYYTDGLSWALSASILMNFASTSEYMEDKYKLSLDEKDLERTREIIVKLLQNLIDARLEDDGWSWRNKLEKSDLYYTNTAIQGLADFMDYVLGDSEDKLGIGEDEELIEFINDQDDELLDKINSIWNELPEVLEAKYMDEALSDELIDRETVLPKEIGRLEPKKEKLEKKFDEDLIMLYYELYLLEDLILTGYDIERETAEVISEKREKLYKIYNNIVNRIDKIKIDEFAHDANLSSLQLFLKTIKDDPQRDYYTIRDASLWPQLIRTLVLYRYYTDPIDDGLDENILGKNGAYSILMDDRQEKETEGNKKFKNTWDKTAFNISITSGAIEGLVDVYDYVKENQKTMEEIIEGDGVREEGLAPIIADKISPYLEEKLESSLKESLDETISSEKELTKEEEKLKKEIIEEIKENYLTGIRSEIQKAVVSVIDDLAGNISPSSNKGKEEIVKDFAGEKGAKKIEDNVGRHPFLLLKNLIWLNYNITSRLLPHVLEEAIVGKLQDEDEYFEKLEEEKLDDLKRRFTQALHRICAMEEEYMKEARENEDLPKFEGLFGGEVDE